MEAGHEIVGYNSQDHEDGGDITHPLSSYYTHRRR